ncbi:MAG: N-acetylglucosamine kinase [Thermomicrobiales bacterium]
MTHAEARGRAFILGVDGGNTKTVAAVATADGTIVGTGRAGCSDIYNAEDEAVAIDAIRSAVDAAMAATGIKPADLLAGAFSLAGADWPEDVDFLEEAVRTLGYGRQTLVVNDAIGALRAGTPDGVGVGVALGTGIAIGARNRDGKIWYSGHWPVAAGGAELGWQALRAVYAAELGLARKTALTEAILEHFAAVSVEEVLHRTTARGTAWGDQRQARLAPVLLDAASRGDDVAREIVLEAAARHADAALAAAAAVGLREHPVRLVLNGGVLRHPSRILEEAIRTKVEAAAPAVETVHDPPEPVIGAVLLAMDVIEAKDGPAVVDRLVATLPAPDLLKTG